MAVLPPDPVFNLRHSDMGAVNCVCFHSTERLLGGTAKGAIYLWDLQVFYFCNKKCPQRKTSSLIQVFFMKISLKIRQIVHRCTFRWDVNR